MSTTLRSLLLPGQIFGRELYLGVSAGHQGAVLALHDHPQRCDRLPRRVAVVELDHPDAPHHNAEGEAKGIYDPGFVIVTRKAKQQALAASAALQAAKTDEERKQAWQQFAAAADSLKK